MTAYACSGEVSVTADVLSQLRTLRGGLADTVQGDPRYLTLSALDKSVAEIDAVASATPGEAGAVPSQVLGQLKTIRDGIADGLRNDHRYLTLSALDKSIAEIGGMLAAAGLIAPEHATPMAPVHFEPCAPAAAPAPAGAQATPATPSEPSQPKTSSLKPILGTAAVLAAGGLAAEVIASEVKQAPLAKRKPKPAAVSDEDDTKPETVAEASGEETDADEAEDHEEAEDSKSEKADDPETAHSKKSGDDEAAGDEADADEAEDHGDEAGDATSEKVGGSDNVDPEKSDDEEAADHDDKADDSKSEKADDAEASESGDAAEKHEDESKKAEDGDAMPDAAGIVPAGKASGYVPMAAKAGAAQYQPGISVKFGKLPNQVDLRSLMTPIEDQGETSSCVANAVAGAYEYWIKKASKQDTNISRLFVYYNARWRGGSQDKDDGSVIQLAMEGLSKFGACPEKVWPFDPRLVIKKPGSEAYKDAAPYRVQDMAQVPLKLDAWKQALAEGKPIVFGCALFDSFDECSTRGGVVPMPSPDDVARAKHSGHSMCAVGYSDSEKVFIVRNSWGAEWGDKGYCYMPYDYLLNEKFNDGDCWVFVPKVPMQPPREVWSNTTDPVTNSGQGVDFPITTYSIADYKSIVVDLFEHVRKPFNATILEDYGQYVSWASKSMWTEFSSFDFTTFLATTAALTGATSLATEFLSETSESTETSESSESEDSEAETEATDAAETDDDETDDDDTEDDSSDADESEGDDDTDESDDDDSEGDEDSEGDNDAEGDEDSEDDETEDDGESDDDAEGDDESEKEDDDDSDEDDGDDSEDEGGDDGGDEGGGDEGGDDDED